jgi:ricin-type beta-trefoil lectin protein
MRFRLRRSTVRLYSVCLLSYALLISLLGPALVRRVEAARFPSDRVGVAARIAKVDPSIEANSPVRRSGFKDESMLRFGSAGFRDAMPASGVGGAAATLSTLPGSTKPWNSLSTFAQIPFPTSSQNPLPLPSPGAVQPGLSPPFPPEMLGVKRVDADFDVTSPPVTQGAPDPNLPNLDQLRASKPADDSLVMTATEPSSSGKVIGPRLPCADCDPQGGGGGGGYYPPNDPNFSTSRLRLTNETGQAGVDLGSRNFNWGIPLVGLPGRAGLDVNLSLYYNSLIWTKDGSYIKYNADMGSPAPGFRLGLPTLQQKFVDAQTGSNAFIMVTPSGGRVEMRRLGGNSYANTYEAEDGSNTQMVEYYQIVARHSGKCLDVAGAGMNNGALLQQWDCLSGTNQQWQLVPTDSGYYKILARHSGKSLDVVGVSGNNGANIQQWDYLGGANQQWQLVPTDSGYYRIVARHSGKVLDVTGAYTYNGVNVQQWAYGGGSNQQWRLEVVAGQTVVRTSDGTQLTFARVALNNEYRCTQIKDRNGNYIRLQHWPSSDYH